MLYPDSPKERKFFVASSSRQNPTARCFAMTLGNGYAGNHELLKENSVFMALCSNG
jgi:hypothetical protein